jgi:cell division protein FtsA
MKYEEIAVGLDIGTTKIVVFIGRENKHKKIEILGMGRAKSIGVHKGVVNNITQTIESIKKAINEAENSSGIKIKEVMAGIAGQHIRSLQHSDYITRNNFDEVINQNNIKQLIEQVNKLAMLPGEEIIHVLPQEYKVDNQEEIKEPVGMYGSRLEANFHLVIGQVSSIRNIGRCIKAAGLKLSGITLEPLASAESVLSVEEKEAGVALVDIGGGTTDVAIFKNDIIRHTAVIPLGGNIITEDIKSGCSIIERQAEQLKIKFGSAWPGENKNTEIIYIPGLRGREPKEVSLKNLSQIINVRITEILERIYMELKNYGHEKKKNKLIAGLVMTGGGSQLRHIRPLSEYVTGMDVRIGYPNEHLSDKEEEYNLVHPEYATAIGLVMKGLNNNKINYCNKNILYYEQEMLYEKKNEIKKQKHKSFLEIWADKFRKILNESE